MEVFVEGVISIIFLKAIIQNLKISILIAYMNLWLLVQISPDRPSRARRAPENGSSGAHGPHL